MVRITGGIFRGRGIQTPDHQQTRPTQAKLRQALFNSLQSQIPDAKVLDLFAGSGALGFEALSRGAEFVVFVESSRSTFKLIQKNIDLLNVLEKTELLGESVTSVIERLKRFAPFDLVLADPPYEENWELSLLTDLPWDELLALNGYFCMEWGLKKSQVSQLPDTVLFLKKVREKVYGDSVLTTYQRVAGIMR